MGEEDNTPSELETLAEEAAVEALREMVGRPVRKSIPAQSARAKLAAACCNDHSLGDLRDGWLQVGGFGLRIEPNTVSNLLMHTVLDGRSIDPIIAEMKELANFRRSVLEAYSALAGCILTKPLSLDENVELLPWSDVPANGQKWQFDRSRSEQLEHSGRVGATSAIRTYLGEHQVIFSQPPVGKLADERRLHWENTLDVVRCITALGVWSVAALGNWIQSDKYFVNHHNLSYAFNSVIFDIKVWLASLEPSVLEGEQLTHVYQRLKKLPHDEKRVIRLALDRLGQGMRREDDVDKAIDVGLALEILLLHDIGGDKGELKYRLATRGAVFLEDDIDKRLNTFELLRDVYDIRSSAVHAGVLRGKKGEVPSQTLKRASSTCARIARKLIDEGRFPDWNRKVLGYQ